ncbi:MAG: DUF711 domain-containing protein [Anaerolineae bacterium CG_4_9_14_3_um_filter_57_17]|nr:DUF711 family protein [bacterium]NCT21025.1 DUF711 family protein [bacterium]OIO83310.1 MAG: hypothetical protein AUK01_12780 [Anaerolineae bacterium CG2_30_57_67]PJB67848.1 MAG: DUF711 domain-containing protein [Anaerolineae bacterium CG_4_9_14_3_um_filter_57_17]
MKIRSITYFFNPGWPLNQEKIQEAGKFLAEAKAAYQAEGYEVQTTRVATVPFPIILGEPLIGLTTRMSQKMSAAIKAQGIDYAAFGPAMPEVAESYELIPDAILLSENIFFAGEMATPQKGISLPAIRACAEVILRNATLKPDGFANLRFAALANVPAGGPFFPGAYADSDNPSFSLALEAADLAVDAFSDAATLDDGRKALAAAMTSHGAKLTSVASVLKYQFSLKFNGIDFSTAPYPEEARSLGAAFERIGAPKAGMHGSLTAAALLTESMERADFARVGFNGLMMPVLEDFTLAARAAEGILTIKDLLLFSAVCGTGLDTIPLPGDVTAEQISALLLDISALALRLNKPLTARLMPIPGKKAGDATGFDFDFFANSKVMTLESAGLGRLFSSDERLILKPR